MISLVDLKLFNYIVMYYAVSSAVHAVSGRLPGIL